MDVPEITEALTPTNDAKRTPVLTAIVASLLVTVLLIGIISIPMRYGGFSEFWYDTHGGIVAYPVVLVHGLGGWGEGSALEDVPYWGATTGSLAKYLRDNNHTVCVPTVGPYSSTWDRTCELYAQLTGTRVDYGAAHSKAHGHERFGRTYDTALVPNWGEKINGGQRVRINLISHSFGGATIRMLASLLAYGDEAERAAAKDETSGLFTGGKADWVFSVTTLCAPHNGSQLTCIVDEIGSVAGLDNATDLLVDLLFKTLKQNGAVNSMPDLMLEQFGVGVKESDEGDVSEALKKIESVGNDHAFYDLSPDGAAALNQTIRTVDSVYYFSYPYSTTQEGKILRGMVPRTDTLPVLYPLALAMGSYTGTTPGGIVIDESWQDNDGLVSVVSAQYPTGEANVPLPTDVSLIERGVWNVAPTGSGDHSKVVGTNASAEQTHRFYDELLKMLNELKR
ncbi:MAG: hypothetical protein IJT44_12770 [Clostridia bacterium]|nr:hypothetical protein [Clostridia bacterium]